VISRRLVGLVAVVVLVGAGCSGTAEPDGSLLAEEVHADLVGIAERHLGEPSRHTLTEDGSLCRGVFTSVDTSVQLHTEWDLEDPVDPRAAAVLDDAESYLRTRNDATEVGRTVFDVSRKPQVFATGDFEETTVTGPGPNLVAFELSIFTNGPCR